MDFARKLCTMTPQTALKHLPVVVLDTSILSPTRRWNAQVAKKRKQVRSVGEPGQCAVPGCVVSKGRRTFVHNTQNGLSLDETEIDQKCRPLSNFPRGSSDLE